MIRSTKTEWTLWRVQPEKWPRTKWRELQECCAIKKCKFYKNTVLVYGFGYWTVLKKFAKILETRTSSWIGSGDVIEHVARRFLRYSSPRENATVSRLTAATVPKYHPLPLCAQLILLLYAVQRCRPLTTKIDRYRYVKLVGSARVQTHFERHPVAFSCVPKYSKVF